MVAVDGWRHGQRWFCEQVRRLGRWHNCMVFEQLAAAKEAEMVSVLLVGVGEEMSGLAGMTAEGERSLVIVELVEGEMLFDCISIHVGFR